MKSAVFCGKGKIRFDDNYPTPTPREDEVLIFGHTPTVRFDYDLPVHIWHGTNRIVIDCGCGHGTGCRLGCLCLNDMKEFYTEEAL